MLISVIYAVVRLLLDVLLSKHERDREVEILVLRHQLNVLRRTAQQARWRESYLGLSPDQRRTPQARPPGLGLDRSPSAP